MEIKFNRPELLNTVDRTVTVFEILSTLYITICRTAMMSSRLEYYCYAIIPVPS